jgi:hypothetical protein
VDLAVALARKQNKRENQETALDDAKDFLRTYLADGRRDSRALKQAADEREISGSTLHRASEEMRVIKDRRDLTWRLPADGGSQFHESRGFQVPSSHGEADVKYRPGISPSPGPETMESGIDGKSETGGGHEKDEIGGTEEGHEWARSDEPLI